MFKHAEIAGVRKIKLRGLVHDMRKKHWNEETIALGICWLSSLAAGAAIVVRFEWTCVWLVAVGMFWLGIACWLDGWVDRYRKPILKFLPQQQRGLGKSTLVAPIVKGSFFLFLQAIFVPIYRASWS